MIYTHFILLLYWVCYCSIHSILALDHVKLNISQAFGMSKRGYRISYNLVAFLTLGLLIFLQLSIKSMRVFQPGFFTISISLFLMAGGLIIMMISIRKYFAEMSGLFNKTGVTLETTGLHQFVRHPLYLGTIIFVLSLTLFWPEVKNIVALSVLLTYTRIGIYLEEKKLYGQFGEQYRSYRNKVPMLIPRLYRMKK